MTLTIRPLVPTDRAAWEPLWKSYLDFYKTSVPPEQYDLTWSRFHDESEPMYALGAFEGDALLGIVHCIYHRSCWTANPVCYLQDLFTVDQARGKGVARALIEAVYEIAKRDGSSRVYWNTQDSNAVAMVLYNKIADRPGFVQYRKML